MRDISYEHQMVIKMEDDFDLRSVSLHYLPCRTQTILSCLLNPPKVIPSPGPEKLPRDWRGLANLTNITSELESYIKEQKDQTAEVLKIWIRDETATIGQLLDFLQRMDRFDVYDDICQDLREALRKGELGTRKESTDLAPTISSNEALTYDDTPWEKVMYDAFLLYAVEDRDFAYMMQERCENVGLKICTVDKLQCGYSTKYAPITELISNRCKRIILLLSPEFLQSPANAFFADYAQALSIESRKRRLIPIMYRTCDLPDNLKFIHPLYFNTQENAIFNFWKKLLHSLDANTSVIQHKTSNGTAKLSIHNQEEELANNLFLSPPPLHYRHSSSTGALDSLQGPSSEVGDSKSLSSVSQISTRSGTAKKFSSAFRSIFRKGKKKQKEKCCNTG